MPPEPLSTALLSLDVARAQLLAAAKPLPAVEVSLAEAWHRPLAADLHARRCQPAEALSAMDGYALRFADLAHPLKLVGEAAAGKPWAKSLPAGAAVRIFTGALLPEGADTVALQEDAEIKGGTVSFPHGGPPRAGAHVRPAGYDFMQGALLAKAGVRVSSRLIGLAAAAGFATLPVRQAPQVALLATGDELVPPGQSPALGETINANSPMLAALLKETGAIVTDLGMVADSKEALQQVLQRATDFDVVVTVGGASVGDYDLVRPALEELGGHIAFWRLALRPGKPFMAGNLHGTQIIGLPGNPVSAYVCTLLLLSPLLLALQGIAEPGPSLLYRQTTTPLQQNGPRRHFLRATASSDTVTALPMQDSAGLLSLAKANALLVRPEQAPAVPAGTSVPVILL